MSVYNRFWFQLHRYSVYTKQLGVDRRTHFVSESVLSTILLFHRRLIPQWHEISPVLLQVYRRANDPLADGLSGFIGSARTASEGTFTARIEDVCHVPRLLKPPICRSVRKPNPPLPRRATHSWVVVSLNQIAVVSAVQFTSWISIKYFCNSSWRRY